MLLHVRGWTVPLGFRWALDSASTQIRSPPWDGLKTPLSSFLNTTCGFSSKCDSQLWPGLFKSELSSKNIPIFEVLAMVWKWKVEAEIWKGRGGRTRKSLGTCTSIQLDSHETHTLYTRGMYLIHTPSLWCRNYPLGFTGNWGSKSLNDLSKIALHEGLE